MEPLTHWLDVLRSIYGHRKWIVAMDVLPSSAHTAQRLRELGASDALCVAATRGAGGPEPEALSPPPILLDVKESEMMRAIRAGLDAMADLSAEHRARIDRFDPDGAARSIGAIFDDGRPVGGRAKFGARAPSWQALEDKTVIDALWDEVGIARAPSRVVPFTREALEAAHDALDEGSGVVIAIDNIDGFHGGAKGTRWAPTRSHLLDILHHFSKSSPRSVRVMPFIEGIPCSIHGIVLSDHVITLRPCEMIVFRSPSTGAFQYAGSATFWEPSEEDRDALRETARRVGEHLHHTLGYLGAFTIDGIMSARGFLPTELNPCFGAALGFVARGISELPLDLLNLAITEGVEADWQPRALEALIREGAEAKPAGGMGTISERAPQQQFAFDLAYEGERWTIASQGARVDGTFIYGENAAGGYFRVLFSTERTPKGESVAPRALHALDFVRRTFGLDEFPDDLVPARSVR